MNAPTSTSAVEKSPPADSTEEVELNTAKGHQNATAKVAIQDNAERNIEATAERISSSVAHLTSNSIEDLEGLTSELQQLQEFLKSESERVQRDIDSALAGIKIIIDTISPWKRSPAALGPVGGTRAGAAAARTNPTAVLGDLRRGR